MADVYGIYGVDTYINEVIYSGLAALTHHQFGVDTYINEVIYSEGVKTFNISCGVDTFRKKVIYSANRISHQPLAVSIPVEISDIQQHADGQSTRI